MIDRDDFRRASQYAQGVIEHSDRWRRSLQSGEAESQERLDASRACDGDWQLFNATTITWCVEPDYPGAVAGAKYKWEVLRKDDPPLFDAAQEFHRASRAAMKNFFASRLSESSGFHRPMPDWEILERFRMALDALRVAAGLSGGGRSPIIASQASIATAMGHSKNTSRFLEKMRKQGILEFAQVPGCKTKWKVWFHDEAQHERIRKIVNPTP